MYVCIYVYTCVYVCIYIYIYTLIHVNICAYIYTYRQDAKHVQDANGASLVLRIHGAKNQVSCSLLFRRHRYRKAKALAVGKPPENLSIVCYVWLRSKQFMFLPIPDYTCAYSCMQAGRHESAMTISSLG